MLQDKFKKIELRDKIKELNEIQQNEIFKIIKSRNINYSSNNNGVFINITNIDLDLINSINKYISFSEKNEERLEKIENKCLDITRYKSNNDSNPKIINFQEFNNISNITTLQNIYKSLNYNKKKEYHLKFINTMKKYQRMLYVPFENEININELKKEDYKI